ncbi:Hypothetical predicted protein [Cloeon dipterum]|uniref:Uncharacterized protein n=1 Tax=Cloeon dipterum TaxID=197152 RepID=A0A8S1E6Z5_9INSE|nr:Hypothetical predicted protein [Cloeon dipterum]
MIKRRSSKRATKEASRITQDGSKKYNLNSYECGTQFGAEHFDIPYFNGHVLLLQKSAILWICVNLVLHPHPT